MPLLGNRCLYWLFKAVCLLHPQTVSQITKTLCHYFLVFFCFLGIQKAQKMHFPGTLNSPSFLSLKWNLSSFTQKVFCNFFSTSTKWLTEITRKRKWLIACNCWKKKKIPLLFFFNPMLYLKIKGMGQYRYAQQLSITCTKWARYMMINFLQNSCPFCWRSIHKHCHEFWYIFKNLHLKSVLHV